MVNSRLNVFISIKRQSFYVPKMRIILILKSHLMMILQSGESLQMSSILCKTVISRRVIPKFRNPQQSPRKAGGRLGFLNIRNSRGITIEVADYLRIISVVRTYF